MGGGILPRIRFPVSTFNYIWILRLTGLEAVP